MGEPRTGRAAGGSPDGLGVGYPPLLLHGARDDARFVQAVGLTRSREGGTSRAPQYLFCDKYQLAF